MKSPILNANLIKKSSTFPDISLTPEIPVDSKLREIQRKLGQHQGSLIVKGPMGSGKTATLMQFVKAHPNRCFSYFLSDNYWILRPSAFLGDLCSQMSEVLGEKSGFINSWENVGIDIEGLKTIFGTLTQKIIRVAKKEKTVFYFVIDGLEWAFSGSKGDRIIDLFPLPSHTKGLHFVGSARSTIIPNITFPFGEEDPPYFSLIETSNYLADVNPIKEDISKIQDISGGMPGYLSIIKRLITEDKISLSALIEKPNEIEALINIQWKESLDSLDNAGKLVVSHGE